MMRSHSDINFPFFDELPWELEMQILRFCDTPSSMNLCRTGKKRKMLCLFIEDRWMSTEFRKIRIMVEANMGDEKTLEKALDDLEVVFEMAKGFMKKAKESKGSLRRSLMKQLEEHGVREVG